jgi:pimeloyl-ACP methyl ester carboxylesterase
VDADRLDWPMNPSEVSLERRGSGPPVVLVHGLGSRWQVFEPILDLLAREHEVIAVDLPGFGGTPLDATVTPGPIGCASWLAELLASLGVERPHVVGSSMGGAVALELGRSGVASRVTAFAPVGFFGDAGVLWVRSLLTAFREFGARAPGLTERLLGLRPARTALMAPLFGHPGLIEADPARADLRGLVGAEGFAAARDSFRGYRIQAGDDLGRLPEIPVTVAWGTRDVVLTHRTQSARAREALPFARHLDLTGCGHLPFSDDPARCADVVLDKD